MIVSGDYGFGGCLHLGSHQRLIAFLLASGDWKFSSGEGERERAFVTCRIYIVSTYKLNRLFHGKRKGKKKKKGEREKKKDRYSYKNPARVGMEEGSNGEANREKQPGSILHTVKSGCAKEIGRIGKDKDQ